MLLAGVCDCSDAAHRFGSKCYIAVTGTYTWQTKQFFMNID